MQEEEGKEEIKWEGVKTMEEDVSMEAGGSTLPNWGMYPQKPYLCAVCAKSQLAPSQCCTGSLESLYCGVKLAD